MNRIAESQANSSPLGELCCVPKELLFEPYPHALRVPVLLNSEKNVALFFFFFYF